MILGTEVTATCSAANVQLCKELGAGEVIDYKMGDLVEALKSKGGVFELVVDNVGTPALPYNQNHKFLKPTGKFVQVGGDASMAGITSLVCRKSQATWLGGGQRSFKFLILDNKKYDCVQIMKWMSEGRLKAVIYHAFEWDDLPGAYKKLKTGRLEEEIVVHVTSK